MGSDGGFFLYAIEDALTSPERVRAAAKPVCAEKLAEYQTDAAFWRRPPKRAQTEEYACEQDELHANLMRAIEAGDLIAILAMLAGGAPTFEDWGDYWFGPADTAPAQHRIVRLSYDDNVGTDPGLALLRVLQDEGLVILLREEWTWT